MIIISQQQSNFVPDKYEERKLRKLRKLIAAGKITFEKKSKKELMKEMQNYYAGLRPLLQRVQVSLGI